MHILRRLTLAAALASLAPSIALAQEPRFTLTVKGGVNAENSEDGLTGTTPAVGVAAAVAFNAAWRGEVEFWLPGYLEDAAGDPRHRDLLFSGAAMRMFRAGRARPYVTMGLSISRTQDWFTFCTAERVPPSGGAPQPALVSCDEPDVIARRRERNDGTDGYALVGGGVEVPLGSRLAFVADLRVSVAPVSVLVRPSAGLSFTF